MEAVETGETEQQTQQQQQQQQATECQHRTTTSSAGSNASTCFSDTDPDLEHERRIYYANQVTKESSEQASQSCVDLEKSRPTEEDTAIDNLLQLYSDSVNDESTIELFEGVCNVNQCVVYPCQLEKIPVAKMPSLCRGTQTAFEGKLADDMLAKLPTLSERLPCLPSLVTSDLRFVVDTGSFLKVAVGNNSIVLLGMVLPERQLVAIKLIPKWSCGSASVFVEASLMTRLCRAGVTPKFYGIGILEDNTRFKKACLVSEFIGDPLTLTVIDMNYLLEAGVATNTLDMSTPANVPLTVPQWIRFLTKFIEGLQRIHSTGIIMHDIKSDNILCRQLDDEWQPLFIDFGSSIYGRHDVNFSFLTDGNDSAQVQKAMRCHEHIAPELLQSGECGEKSDVYAVGKLLAMVACYLKSQAIALIAKHCQSRSLDTRYDLNTVLQELYQIIND